MVLVGLVPAVKVIVDVMQVMVYMVRIQHSACHVRLVRINQSITLLLVSAHFAQQVHIHQLVVPLLLHVYLVQMVTPVYQVQLHAPVLLLHHKLYTILMSLQLVEPMD